MKKLFVLIMLLTLLLLSCAPSVSQEDYDTVVEQISLLELDLANYRIELEQTISQLLETESELDSSSASLLELQDEYDVLDTDYAAYVTETQETIESLYSQLRPHVCSLLRDPGVFVNPKRAHLIIENETTSCY